MSLNLMNIFACFTSSFKALLNEVKEDEPKGIPKTLIPSSWVQKLVGWKKLKNKLKRDQATHL
jgi:hypothetical protein